MENFWHILVYNFFLVHFCTNFSTFMKSAWNSAFLYTFFDFFKNNFLGVLANNTKSAYFRHIFVNNFFFKKNFSFFSTFLKSAWNSAFFDTFSDFFKPKFLVVLMEFGLKLCKKYKYDFKKKHFDKVKMGIKKRRILHWFHICWNNFFFKYLLTVISQSIWWLLVTEEVGWFLKKC